MKDTNNQGKSFQERLAEAEERWKNATISDIIAAKRREANDIEASAIGSFKAGEDWDEMPFTESDLASALDLAETKRKEADRLEAAHKREVGNRAALREALEELLDAMYDMGIDEETVSIAAESPNCHMHSKEHLDAIKKAKAALAAPPRNCDRFGGDNAKLQKVYYSECGKEYEPRDPIGRQAYFVGYGNWLLALAEKGGNNANK